MFSSLHKALNVLEAFTLGAPELGVTELAAKLGIPKSTVHRTRATLEDAATSGNIIRPGSTGSA